ncbi:PRC-barrel domain-containing protein [Simiduia litorea]|uniref:PRC-barrel domain-containing protein n=1 Tax=Simiduia litorea TaxID=1435348 RepID=UPI0036F38F68
MLRSLNEINRFKLQGIDSEIGLCKDFLFDDEFWVVRYMVIDTNKWLPGGRKVLISPISLGDPDWDTYQFPINLTKKGVEASPQLEEHQPLSHKYEAELFKYYGYGAYWMGDNLWGTYAHPTPLADAGVLEGLTELKKEDRNLRSVKELKGYRIHALDKDLGHIDDFIVGDDNWRIPYIVIDTNNWLPGGRKVLISRNSIESVNWGDRSITVNLGCRKIENGPEFYPKKFADPKFEREIRQYYGE